MIFESAANYYETLEVRPDASAQEIRNAYLRLKASYRKDNPALYSVLDPSETEDMIAKIEEAFQVLSDPDSRREYDERMGHVERIDRKIISIDRSLPMDDAFEGDPLIAPSTAFDGMTQRGESVSSPSHSFKLPTQPQESDNPFFNSPREKTSVDVTRPIPAPESTFIDRKTERTAVGVRTQPAGDPVLTEIANETEWRGTTLKRLRELRRYSLDDIAQITKISKTYVIALEEEQFTKLPAPVFVRGFLLQIAKTLKIPPEPVAAAYMARFQKRPGV